MRRELTDLETNEIDIHVVGYSASGKSTIQHLISQVLKDYGFNVIVKSTDYDGIAPKTPEELDLRLSSVLEKNKSITINEVQAVKNILQ